MRKRWIHAAAVLMAASLLLAACGGDDGGEAEGGGGGETAGDTPAATDEAAYTAVDFGFQGPETLTAGNLSLTLKNDGKEPHMMVFVRLTQGKTIDDVMTFIKEQGIQGPPPPWAKQVKGGINGVGPGKSKTAKVDFSQPGDYAALCFVTSKKNDNKAHAELGMVLPITVEA